MNDNFNLLYDRIIDVNKSSDLGLIRKQLKSIKQSVICVGSGGSRVVSNYASKIFICKNQCFVINVHPRDLLYNHSVKLYQNIFVCSYSGKNYGVDISLALNHKKFLFTSNKSQMSSVCTINYNSTIDKEKSFISLGATLIPMSILLQYYIGNNSFYLILDSIFREIPKFNLNEKDFYFEIFSGFDTSVAAIYLESTLVEAGLGLPIVHDKYDYCHGRSTLSYHYQSHILIYLKAGNTELDNVILSEASKYYKDIIIIESNYNDIIVDNFNLVLKCMHLTKQIAEIQKKDLSKVKYSPFVKKLYHFNGDM